MQHENMQQELHQEEETQQQKKKKRKVDMTPEQQQAQKNNDVRNGCKTSVERILDKWKGITPGAIGVA